MSLHHHDLRIRLTRFLDRRSVPRRLEDKPQAQADEINALVEALARSAPRDPDALREWWPGFEARIGEAAHSSWPTIKDVRECAKASLADRPAPEGEKWKIDSAELHARRMKAGEPVGEGWLYGVLACEMISRGLIDRETMERHRKAAFWNRADAYNEEEARRWEADVKQRHEHGKELWKAREDKRIERDTSRMLPRSERPAA